MAQPFESFQTASSDERRALVASALGWMLDGMDVTLYAMVITELLRDLQLSTARAGLLASLTLIDSAGIAMYSVFTAACGFSHGMADLAIFRFLVG